MRRLTQASLLVGSVVLLSACGLVLGLPGSDEVKNDWDGGNVADATGADAASEASPDGGAPDASPDANPDGSCSPDLQKDPANCGACGHDCLGGGCSAGKCQPIAIVGGDDAGVYGPNAVAVDATHVYFADSYKGAVYKVPKDPKTSTVVQDVAKPSNYFQIWRVATNGTNVYFVDTGSTSDEGDVWECPVAGCGAANENRKKLFGGVGFSPYDVLVVGNSLFFTTDIDATGTVRKCPIPGCAGGPVTIAQGQDSPELLTTDETGTNVFWSVYNTGAVRSCPASSTGLCTPTTSITGEPSLYGVAARGSRVWSARLSGSQGRIVVKDGANQSTFASGQTWAFQVVVDANYVWWTNRTDNPNDSGAGVNGTLMRCPVTGCAPSPELMHKVPGGLRGIAQDATAIYYTEYSAGKVWKLAK
jgi:hypothetical protein